MPKRSAVAEYTREEQRESVLAENPLTHAITGTETSIRTRGGEMLVDRAPQLDVSKLRGVATDPRFNNLKAAMLNRLNRTGIDSATLVSFLPLPLVVNSPMGPLKDVIVPACGPGDQFTFHTWREVYIDNMLSGEGTKQPWDFHPIQMVDAFADEYKEMGGVVGFKGEIEDFDPDNSPAMAEAVKESKTRMFAYAQSIVREAESFWNDSNGSMKMAIVDKHRLFAQMLFDNRRLAKLPEWMKFERNDLDMSEVCPVCKVEPKRGAAICASTGCGYVIDPAAAFRLQVIDESHMALERLTRAQVEELGISAYVAETSDERKARLSSGKAKPLSTFQASQQNA